MSIDIRKTIKEPSDLLRVDYKIKSAYELYGEPFVISRVHDNIVVLALNYGIELRVKVDKYTTWDFIKNMIQNAYKGALLRGNVDIPIKYGIIEGVNKYYVETDLIMADITNIDSINLIIQWYDDGLINTYYDRCYAPFFVKIQTGLTLTEFGNMRLGAYNDMVKKYCKACEDGYYCGCKGHIINWRLRYIVENTDEDIYDKICKLSWLERFYD